MYRQAARVYDALTRGKDYAGACTRLRALLQRIAPRAVSLLDVGTGTGRHLEHLQRHYAVEGLDLSAEMLAVARARCPGVSLHLGSMIDFRLVRRFGIVTCLQGSIGHAGTVANLERAIASMAAHLEPGGALVVEPWITPERFRDDELVFDQVDDPDLKVARMYVQRRVGRLSVLDSHYVIGTPEGVTHFDERQELGLFTDAEYRGALCAANLLEVEAGVELFGYGLYAALAPGRTQGEPKG